MPERNTADWMINFFREAQRVITGMVDSLDQTFISVVTRLAPIIAPLPSAISVYTAMTETLNVRWEVAAIAATAIELIGMFQSKTALRSRNWNLVKNKTDPRSPFGLALTMAAIYFATVFTLALTIEATAADLKRVIYPSFVLIAASVYVSNAIETDLTRWENERDKRLRQQEQKRGLTADLAHLRDQLANLQSQISDSETHAANLRDQITQDEATAAALRNEIATNETRAAGLRDQLTNLQSQISDSESRRPTNGSLNKANASRKQQIAQRRDQVRQLLDLDLSNSEMSERLDVSLDTIRRDIEAIEAEGKPAFAANGKVHHA